MSPFSCTSRRKRSARQVRRTRGSTAPTRVHAVGAYLGGGPESLSLKCTSCDAARQQAAGSAPPPASRAAQHSTYTYRNRRQLCAAACSCGEPTAVLSDITHKDRAASGTRGPDARRHGCLLSVGRSVAVCCSLENTSVEQANNFRRILTGGCLHCVPRYLRHALSTLICYLFYQYVDHMLMLCTVLCV